MYKALFVVVEMGVEFRITATIVMSGYTVKLQGSFVYNGAFAAFSFQRELALFLYSYTVVCFGGGQLCFEVPTNKALYIDTKEMPRNCRKLSGMPNTQEQTLASNGVLRQKQIHINREQNQLLFAEKLAILQSKPATILNKRSELNSKCRHKNKFKLKSFIA